MSANCGTPSPPPSFVDVARMLNGDGVRITVKIEQIKVPDALVRALTDDGIAECAESIKTNGLLSPLIVDTSLTLVAGARRLRALRLLGYETVDVIMRAFNCQDARDLAEIDEQLMWSELSPLERGEHLARRKVIYERMSPRTGWGVASATGGASKDPRRASFVEATAKVLGVGRSTVAEQTRIGAMPQEVRDALRGTPVARAKKQLVRLSRRPRATQLRVATLVRSGRADDVDGAFAALRQGDAEPEPEAETGRFHERTQQMVACRDTVSDALRQVTELFSTLAERPKPETMPVVRDISVVAEKLGECVTLLERVVPESKSAPPTSSAPGPSSR